jgi:antitoxin component YwqK of YwqJK toxin-antitoxin module
MNELPEYDWEDVEHDKTLLLVHKDVPVTGHVVVKNDHGVVVESDEYHDGFKHGEALTFYDSGRRRSRVPFRVGVPEGTGMAWYESGALKAETIYKRGRVDSTREWDEDGNEKVVEKSDPVQEW